MREGPPISSGGPRYPFRDIRKQAALRDKSQRAQHKMQELRLLVVLWLASLTPQAWAAVRVKGFAASGEPVGTLNVPGTGLSHPVLQRCLLWHGI